MFAEYLSEARGSAIRRGQFQATGEGLAFGVTAAALPNISAYVLTAPQEGAEVLLRVWTPESAAGDVILARRRAGVGRSVGLALPLTEADNAAWPGSAQARAMLGDALKWCLRRGGDSRFAGSKVCRGGECAFRLDARDASGPMNRMMLKLDLISLGQKRPHEPFSFSCDVAQTAPGRYEAVFDEPEGPFALAVRDASGREIWRKSFARAYAKEYAALGADWASLRRLAKLTGGRIAAAGRLGELTASWRRRRYTHVWPVLLAAAILLMLADWTATRAWKRWA